MPNIRRTFPGKSQVEEEEEEDDDDDDDSDDSDDDDDNINEATAAAGVRTTHSTATSATPAVYRGGGKQFGKSLRPPTADADEDDDDDDEDDDVDEKEDETANAQRSSSQQYTVQRGSGKQLAGSGKYLRPSHDDDDEESDNDDEAETSAPPAPAVVKYQPVINRPGGGKNILRMSQPQQDDDEKEEDEDDSDEEEPPPAAAAPVQSYRVMGRGGGKSLSRMTQPESEDDEDDEDDDDVVEVVAPPAAVVQKVSAAVPQGKQMSRPPVATAAPTMTNIVRGPSGGKQLSRPATAAAPAPVVQQLAAVSAITRGPSGGKQLRRPDSDSDGVQTTIGGTTTTTGITATPSSLAGTGSIVARSPAGGKILRRPEPDDDDDESAAVATAAVVTRSPGGGKQLMRSAAQTDDGSSQQKATASAASAKPAIGRSPAGGKQLRRAVKDDSEEDEEMSFGDDDDDDDDDEDFKEKAPAKKKPAPRPKRAAATRKRKTVVEESEDDEELFGDDDVSDDDDEAPLDINNTEALIKDEKDRKYLDSLPELEREVILGERFEKLKEKQDMQKAIAEAKRKEQEKSGTSEPKNKRKTPVAAKEKAKPKKTAGDEQMAKKLAGTRSSARSRDVSGTKSKKAAALAALKRERKIQQDMEESSSDGSDIGFDDDDDDSDEEYNEDDGAKRWRDRAKGTTTKTSTPLDEKGDGSDMDIDDGDDDDKPVKRSGGAPAVDAAGLEDFIKVTIPRRRLARWCNEPFFDAAVLECFVRLFIGEDEKGDKVYRLCEIVDVKVDSKKTYKFPVTDKSETPVSTNKVLRLRFSNNEKEFPMYLVSDTPPTEVDVQKYSTTQKNNRAECLTKRRATKLRRTQDHLVSTYTYTTEDIERNLQQRKIQGKSKANLGSEQTRAAIAVQGARGSLQEAERRLVEAKKALMEFSGPNHEEHDLEKSVEVCKRAVNDTKKVLEVKLQEEQTALSAAKNRNMKLTGRAKDQKWAIVNERALQMNQKVDRESYKAQKEADARKAAGEKEKFNPYARRKVKPKILWEVGQAKDDDDDDQAEEKKDSDGMKIGGGTKDSLSTIPSLVPEAVKTILLPESHQDTIDDEGLALTASSSTGHRLGAPNRVRKGLDLSEYFVRKEQGTL